MIFIDSNVPMYLVGAPHPNRDRVVEFLTRTPSERFVTSAEVYQEVIHRYASISRHQAIRDAFRVLDGLVTAVFPITRTDVGVAEEIVAAHPELSSGDCLHLAVMQGNGISRALTFDRGFKSHPNISVLP
ncbi:MAG: type II toxin-antitoxin system VapC family toxin [Gammaproteobacteria bacterium]|nr:type II toxin-antitoxin system VapC family toxin [Gammaproteobacteria bacterium]MCY4344117.1 type II toxin-antitoxin system VapC family toxin [Gammaproteobacteria bacterium]